MSKPPAVYHDHQLLRFPDVTNDVQVSNGTTASMSVIPDRAGWTVYLRRITGSVTKSSTTATLTFQDTGDTPKVVALLKAASGTGSVELLDARPKGVALQEGKGLVLIGSAADVAGVFYVEAYQWQSGALELSEL